MPSDIAMFHYYQISNESPFFFITLPCFSCPFSYVVFFMTSPGENTLMFQ